MHTIDHTAANIIRAAGYLDVAAQMTTWASKALSPTASEETQPIADRLGKASNVLADLALKLCDLLNIQDRQPEDKPNVQ